MEGSVPIVDILDEFYDLLGRIRYTGLRSPLHIYKLTPLEIPQDFEQYIRIQALKESKLEWVLDLDILEGSIGSIKSGSKNVSLASAYKHRHDYVCEAISLEKTDKKLSDVFGILNDDDDTLTPDYVFINARNDRHFLEVTTRSEVEDRIASMAFSEKHFKYSQPIAARTQRGKVSTLTILVVTYDAVYSNAELTQDLVNELVARMRIAVSLERLASSKGINIQRDEREGLQEAIKLDIKKSVSSIGILPKTHELDIDESFIQKCLTEPSIKDFENILVRETKQFQVEEISYYKEKEIKCKEDFVKNFQGRDLRIDPKSVCILPFLVSPQETQETSDIKFISLSDSTEKPHLSELWSVAFSNYLSDPNITRENPGGLLQLALEEDYGEVQKTEIDSLKNKKTYHRVSVKDALSENTRLQLAAQGVWAKKYKDRVEMQNMRDFKKKGFRWTVPTTDIDEFLSDKTDFLESLTVHSSHSLPLLERANSLTGNSNVGVEIIRSWEKTPLFRAFDIYADIAYEVAISNKQNCPPGVMILKKLRRYNIYLLISPTNSREHTFVSVCAPGITHRAKHDGVFAKRVKTSTSKLYDFVSFRSGKYENAASMPSAVISLASFWAWFYEMDGCSPSHFRENPEAMKMLKLSLLVRCENKAQTEEVITAARYMYMEIFKTKFSALPPLPFSVISKVPTCGRSRLTIYLIRKLVERFQEMSEVKPTRVPQDNTAILEEGEDSLPADHWRGLINWMTGGTVSSATMAVNLFYVGYLKDKNENPEGNTDFSLINKTVEEELSFDRTSYQASRGECTERPNSKQFHLESIKVGCKIMEMRLQSTLGPMWKEVVGDEVLQSLSERMTSEIASLKASCSEEHKKKYPEASLETSLSAGRLKVLEAVHHKITKMGLNPYTHFEYFINLVESTSKGIIADLFKKQQHGGLREIYVLTLESRVIQLFVETCSRVLCSYFEEETLTHPSNKTKKLDEHKYTVSRISNRDSRIFVDYCSSTDKTRWNQNFVMPAMAVPLIRLLPKHFHGAISRSLNLWTRKLIKVPPRVQRLMLNNVELSSDVYSAIKKEFWSATGGSLFDEKKGQFVRLQTGMMQGILHYTSSLLHLTFLNATSSVIPQVLHSAFPEYKFKCTQVCSSDDSASIISVMSPANSSELTKGMIKVFRKAAIMLHVLDNLAPYFCMKTSPKSNTANLDNIEFNSEFLFKNTLAVPIIKYVAASLNITESESFNERFHTMYNLISDLFQSGFPAENTHVCQLAQAYNHYRTMGHSTNPLFTYWGKDIIDYPDPSLGFFLVDTQFIPGVLGFSYSHWKAAKSTPILKRRAQDAISESATVNFEGGIVSTLVVKHGDVSRWKTMATSLTKDMDLRAEIEKNPRLLFFPPENTRELAVSLAIKATMPAVAKSMRKGNPYMQALATTVYALTTHCFSRTTVTQDLDNKLKKQVDKTSLLSELARRKRMSAGEISEAELAVSFPHCSRYLEAEQVIEKAKSCSLVRCHKFRHRKSLIVIQPMTLLLPINLKEICMHKWFGHRTRVTGKVRDRCWFIYKNKLPWLMETIEDTLTLSPFNSYQELANFISSQVYKPRVFMRIGPAIHSSRFRGQLFQMIKKSQRVGHVMKSEAAATRFVTTGDLVSRTCLALSLPEGRSREEEVRRILVSSPPIVSDLSEVSKTPKREQKLALIQHFAKNGNTPEILSTLMNVGCGITYAYTHVQKRVETDTGIKWTGFGQCVALFDNIVVVLDMMDDKCELITTNNWKKLKAHSSTLDEIFRELRLKPHHTVGRYVAKYNGGRLMEVSPLGTRVIMDSHIEPDLYHQKDLHLKLGRNNISLVQDSPQGLRTVVHFASHPRDVTISPSEESGTDYQNCWMTQRPLKAVHATAVLHKCAERSRQARKKNVKAERNPLIEWIDLTLRARLCQKGLSVGTPVSHLSEVYVPEEEKAPKLQHSDEFYKEMIYKFLEDDEAGEQFVKFALKAAGEEDAEGADYDAFKDMTDEESQWCHVVNNFFNSTFEDLRYMGKKTGQGFRFLHPFWDDLINTLSEDYPKFWQQVMAGEVILAEEQVSKDIQEILRLEKKSEVTSLSREGVLLARNLRLPGLDDDEDEENRAMIGLVLEEEQAIVEARIRVEDQIFRGEEPVLYIPPHKRAPMEVRLSADVQEDPENSDPSTANTIIEVDNSPTMSPQTTGSPEKTISSKSSGDEYQDKESTSQEGQSASQETEPAPQEPAPPRSHPSESLKEEEEVVGVKEAESWYDSWFS